MSSINKNYDYSNSVNGKGISIEKEPCYFPISEISSREEAEEKLKNKVANTFLFRQSNSPSEMIDGKLNENFFVLSCSKADSKPIHVRIWRYKDGLGQKKDPSTTVVFKTINELILKLLGSQARPVREAQYTENTNGPSNYDCTQSANVNRSASTAVQQPTEGPLINNDNRISALQLQPVSGDLKKEDFQQLKNTFDTKLQILERKFEDQLKAQAEKFEAQLRIALQNQEQRFNEQLNKILQLQQKD